jgi:hypothetical protein
MLKPPISITAMALYDGSMPQRARYVGRCVVRNTSCRPHTKKAIDITT